MPNDLPELDEYGHLKHVADWTPAIALQIAEQDGVMLSDEAMHILIMVRQFYIEFGYPPMTRALVRYLQQRVGTDVTSDYLMQQFSTGTVARTLARLSGLPKPANCL